MKGAVGAALQKKRGFGSWRGGEFPINCKPRYNFSQATLEEYKQLKDEYFGLVRQAGELELQLKEKQVACTLE